MIVQLCISFAAVICLACWIFQDCRSLRILLVLLQGRRASGQPDATKPYVLSDLSSGAQPSHRSSAWYPLKLMREKNGLSKTAHRKVCKGSGESCWPIQHFCTHWWCFMKIKKPPGNRSVSERGTGINSWSLTAHLSSANTHTAPCKTHFDQGERASGEKRDQWHVIEEASSVMQKNFPSDNVRGAFFLSTIRNNNLDFLSFYQKYRL